MREVFTLEDIFNIMIELETLGNHHYIEMQNMTDDLELRSLFGQLAEQEIAHKALYTSYKHKNITFNQNEANEEYRSYMDALLKGTVQFLEESRVIKDFDHGFGIAVSLEKDTILFLSELRRIIDSAYYEAIDKIINEERKHLEILYAYKSRL